MVPSEPPYYLRTAYGLINTVQQSIRNNGLIFAYIFLLLVFSHIQVLRYQTIASDATCSPIRVEVYLRKMIDIFSSTAYPNCLNDSTRHRR